MARNEQKRQNALAKKRKRTNQIRKETNQRRNMSNVAVLIEASKGTWAHCYERSDQGISSITVTKRMRGRCCTCVFLVDEFCLGVKTSFIELNSNLELLDDRKRESHAVEIAPAYALKKILNAIEGARKIGFDPHRDTMIALEIFKGTDASACTVEFQFGDPLFDGKPHYISGPLDSPERIQSILGTLGKLGKGNFQFTLMQSFQGSNPHFAELEDEFEDDSDEEDYIEDESNTVDGQVIGVVRED